MNKPLSIIIAEYLASSAKRGHKTRTVEDKRTLLQRLYTWLNGREITLETADLYTTYLQEKGYKQNSIRYVVAGIRALVTWGYARKYFAENWGLLLDKPPSQRPKFKYIEPELVEKIIIAGTTPKPFKFGVIGDNSLNVFIKSETREALRFAIRTGLRIHEIIDLHVSDLNLNDSPPSFRIAPSKGHDDEFAWIPLDMAEEMKRRASEKGRKRVFETTDETCNKALQRGCEALGVEVFTVHKLRHIFCTALIKNKVPLAYVQKAARHKSIKLTVDTYGHLEDVNDIFSTVNQAHPLTRKAISFEEKVKFYERILTSFNLSQDSGIEPLKIQKSGDKFTFTIQKKT